MVPPASREAGVRCWHFQASGWAGCLLAPAGGRERRLAGDRRVLTTLANLEGSSTCPGLCPAFCLEPSLFRETASRRCGVGGGEAGPSPGADEDL